MSCSAGFIAAGPGQLDRPDEQPIAQPGRNTNSRSYNVKTRKRER